MAAHQYDDPVLQKYSTMGKAGAEFASAVQAARDVCADAGINLDYDEDGNATLSPSQVCTTLRHSREDVSATLNLQFLILRRLDRNRYYMWAIITLLILILMK